MLNLFRRAPKQPAQLPVHTDIHCHIVPGVDDGSPDARTSVELVARMKSWGYDRIFASPHVADTTFENTPDILDPALDELREALNHAGIDVEVHRHAEYRIDDYFASQLERGLVTALPDNYILIENSFIQEPWNLEQLVFDLKLKGYNPILAHPERYSYYSIHNRDRYKALHDAGLMFQINLLSLADYYGGKERETAEWLIGNNLVDFLGSDLHHHRHADSIEAYLRTSRAAKQFEALAPRLLNDRL